MVSLDLTKLAYGIGFSTGLCRPIYDYQSNDINNSDTDTDTETESDESVNVVSSTSTSSPKCISSSDESSVSKPAKKAKHHKSSMVRECRELEQSDFAGGRAKNKFLPTIQTCIPCDKQKQCDAPNRIINYSHLREVIESDLHCKQYNEVEVHKNIQH